MYVPQFTVAASCPGTGASADVTAVRVVVDAESLGFYPLPARIPVLAAGPRRLRLEPAVAPAGQRLRREVYPMYEAFEAEVEFVAGATDTIAPVVAYAAAVTCALSAGFEDDGEPFATSLAEGDVALARTETDAVSGESAGVVRLATSAPVFERVSPVLPFVRDEAAAVWLELDYRGTVPLAVGLQPDPLPGPAERGGRYSQGANPRDGWRKFYFDLGANSPVGTGERGLRLGLLAAIDTTAVARGEAFVDNVKLLYR